MKKILAFAALALFFAPAANAAVVVQYDIPASGTSSGIVDAFFMDDGGTLSSASPGTLVFANNATFGYRFSGWEIGANEAAAIAAGDFVTFGFTPLAGTTVEITEFVFELTRPNTASPESFSLYSSADGYGTAIASFSITDGVSGANLGESVSHTISLTSSNADLSALSSLTSATDFRLVGWNAELSGRLRFGVGSGTAVLVNGNLSAVPEPSSLALLGLAAAPMAFRRRRS